MRISDWSSDVCSSDLRGLVSRVQEPAELPAAARRADGGHQPARALRGARFLMATPQASFDDFLKIDIRVGTVVAAEPRSEEHTSELQSLMRISYAVFCLKKKNTKNSTTN